MSRFNEDPDGRFTINNPILRGTQPDPSIVRVGEDFYLATSTFDLMPGILIHHSRDLREWRILGGAVERPAQYRRDGLAGPICLFAPTLRHAGNEFFLVCTNVADNQGNFILRASDPSGPWSDALWLDSEAFDPSLLFDDGRWLYTRRSMRPREDGQLGPVEQTHLDIDTGEIGPFVPMSPNHGGFESNDIEGPHLYRIGEWYYLLSAEGGTWRGHMETCARSRSPWGPFEPAPNNPVLTHRHRVGHPIQSIGHADLFDDADGNWWAVALGTRHHAREGFTQHHRLGRETFLAPVTWTSDGWPVIGDHGEVELRHRSPHPLPANPTPPAGTSWVQQGWRAVGQPSPEISVSDSSVTIPRGAQLGGPHPGVLLLPQTEEDQQFEATIPTTSGAGMGVAIYTDSKHFAALVVSAAGPDGARLTFTRRVDDMDTIDAIDLPAPAPIGMRIVTSEDTYRFVITVDGSRHKTVGAISARLLSAESAEWFVGAHFALFAAGDEGTVTFTDVSRQSPPRA